MQQHIKPGNVRKFSWFTLVEIIVVITILVILWTIAFINLGGYSSSARDSARVSNLTNLKKGLDIYQIKTGTYPMPEGPVTVNASGSTILGYQWFAKEIVGSVAKLSNGATKDPSDATIFTTYSVNANQTKMQAMVFLEDASSVTAFYPHLKPSSLALLPKGEGNKTAFSLLPLPLGEGRGEGFGAWFPSLIPQTFASTTSDYSKRYPATLWDGLGILLGNTGATLNQPLQETGTGLDLVKTTTLSGYTMVFSKNDTTASVVTSGTGAYTGSLFTFAYNKRDDLLSNKALAGNDPSLVGYWDMETTVMSGSTNMLKDLSNSRADLFYYTQAGITNFGTSHANGMDFITDGSRKVLKLQHTPGSTTNTFGRIGVINASFLNGMTMILVYKNPIMLPSFYNDTPLSWGIYWYHQNSINNVWVRSNVFSGSTNNCVGPLFCYDGIIATSVNRNAYNNYVMRFANNQHDFIVNGLILYHANNLTSGNFTSGVFDFDIWGSFTNANFGFNGTIDEVRIYNRALSDSEIQALYNATK